MSRSVVLEFKYRTNGSWNTIQFDDHEVEEVFIRTRQDGVLKKLENRAPRYIKKASEWREIDVKLRQHDVDVSIDVNTLRQVTVDMSMQLKYQNGTVADTMTVRIDPRQKLPYFAGYKDAEPLLKMKLYEVTGGASSSPALRGFTGA
jgi:hypothetical protein